MAELIIEPEAEAELEEAGDRYEESVPGLGLEFLVEMRKRTLELAEAPFSYPVFGGVADVRCAAQTTLLALVRRGRRLFSRRSLRQLPELQRRHETPSDKVHTLAALASISAEIYRAVPGPLGCEST